MRLDTYAHLRNEKNTVPEFAELGEKGQARWLDMQLKLIADVGVIGVPNAGKSSILAALTNAKPKIADYPFTTVVPNLGVCQMPGAERRTLVLLGMPMILGLFWLCVRSLLATYLVSFDSTLTHTSGAVRHPWSP